MGYELRVRGEERGGRFHLGISAREHENVFRGSGGVAAQKWRQL